MKPLSIYIHIPFCIKKCEYCDFLSAPAEETVIVKYMEALLTEMDCESPHYRDYQVRTVFIGGGTPSCVEAEAIGRVFSRLKERFIFDQTVETEITIEINPGTVSEEKLRNYREAGINRLSIGLQSADNAELKILGRIHSWEDFQQTYETARRTGFHNVNIDLMSALPGQTRASYATTLSKVIALKPEHISAYSLMIEEGTQFYDRYGPGTEGEADLPSEEEERKIYQLTEVLLQQNRYERYEISNYSKAGFACRHNMVYWQRGDYVGFGLGAASMVADTRWSNVRDLGCYLSHPEGRPAQIKEAVQVLSPTEKMEEFMFLGLRLMQGVSREKFREAFSQDIDAVYGDILDRLERQKLIINGSNIVLTPYGIDISNYVMRQFLI